MDFNVILIIIDIVVILFAVSIHEASHGFVAYKFGDPTPEIQGRLTLNPIAHLDLVGSVIIPFFLVLSHLPVFGWAKPVMINPGNFKGDYNQIRKKTAWVALAGPGSNFLVAIVAGLILRFIFISNPQIKYIVYTKTYINFSPLVGLSFILFELFVINTFLGLFNLIPIPPLDGGNIVSGFLPPKAAYTFDKIKPFGFMILLILLFTNLYSYFIMPVFKLFLIIPG